MTEPTSITGTDANSVRKVVSVQDIAGSGVLASYKTGKANAVDAVIEPRVGGRWYERGEGDCGRLLKAFARAAAAPTGDRIGD